MHDDANMNAGTPPSDWWAEIERYHGHVGPWNVLGYRMGQRALKEFGEQWGGHGLEATCHVPLKTPFTCLVDGLAVGTGNSMGRLDLKLAEASTRDAVFVEFKQLSTGRRLVMRPYSDYLQKIETASQDGLHRLARECVTVEEAILYTLVYEP